MENDTMNRLATQIRHYRNLRRLTQEELAYRANITTQHLGTIERGARRNVTLLTVQKIANALELNLCQLICEEDKANLERMQSREIEIRDTSQTQYLLARVSHASQKEQNCLLKILTVLEDCFDNF